MGQKPGAYGPGYDVYMTKEAWLERAAALHALVTKRPGKISVAVAVARSLETMDPAAVWTEQEDALFPLTASASSESRQIVESWLSDEYRTLTVLDDDYPEQLRAVHDAPPFLFVRGDISLLGRGGVSIVGTRHPSQAGIAQACEAAVHLSSLGVPVISGLARGVDFEAHSATLGVNGAPIGVVATPIGGPYTPVTSRDLHELVAAEGVLVSQFAPGTGVSKSSFIRRNATMSGLGIATIVIEAGEHSGTRAQARIAMDHGRPLILSSSVVRDTTWGRDLADGTRPNVDVVSSRQELHTAIDQVRELAALDVEQVLALSPQ